MYKPIWRVETPRTFKDFGDFKKAKTYLRKHTKGNIYVLEGSCKRLVYTHSTG